MHRTYAIAVALLLANCSENKLDVGEGAAGSNDPTNPSQNDDSSGSFGSNDGGDTTSNGECSEREGDVYVVTATQSDSETTTPDEVQKRNLVRFHPPDLSLTPIGSLDCLNDITNAPGKNFIAGFAIDRNNTGWLEVSDELHGNERFIKVDIRTATCEDVTSSSIPLRAEREFHTSDPPAGYFDDEFQLAFSRKSGSKDTLFGMPPCAECRKEPTLSRLLVTVDPQTNTTTSVGDLPPCPLPFYCRLMGTGDGRVIFSVFDMSSDSTRLVDIDPVQMTTKEIGSFRTNPGTGVPYVAFWGSYYWIFGEDGSIQKLDTAAQTTEPVRTLGTDVAILGASSSTCAPLTPVN